MNFELSNTRMRLKEMKKNRDYVKKLADEAEQAYKDWKLRFTHRTRDSLIAHGKSIIEPAKQYYTSLFSNNEGDSYIMRRVDKGCKIFYTLSLKVKQNETS